jgi:hypothetical protein
LTEKPWQVYQSEEAEKHIKGEPMTALEAAILNGAVQAQERYKKISGGSWLYHGPESFIESYVGEALHDEGYEVYFEISPKRIDEELRTVRHGRPPKNVGEGFDLLVWYKSKDEPLAIIEIKRAMNVDPVHSDAQKVRKHLGRVAKLGYLLVYSEAKRQGTLEDRFENWADETGTDIAGDHIAAEVDDGWRWGFVLLKV